jgi:hypothetical protein
MSAFQIRTAVLTAAAAIGLSACMSPYGYGGVGVGYGSGYGGGYYDGYGYPGYAGGYGYEPYWGWYDGYYYPGTGYYVYDRWRRPHRWDDDHRRHWEGRRANAMSSSEFRRQMEARRDRIDQQNWSAFEQRPTKVQRVQRRDDRSQRIERSNRVQRERSSNRSERSRSGKQSAEEFRRSMENRD